jgi:hypothetical protein
MPLPTTGELEQRFIDAAEAAASRHGFDIAQNAGSDLRAMAKLAAEQILMRARQFPTEKEQARYIAANEEVGRVGMATIVGQMIAARETLPNYGITHGGRLGEETLAEARRILCPFLFFC